MSSPLLVRTCPGLPAPTPWLTAHPCAALFQCDETKPVCSSCTKTGSEVSLDGHGQLSHPWPPKLVELTFVRHSCRVSACIRSTCPRMSSSNHTRDSKRSSHQSRISPKQRPCRPRLRCLPTPSRPRPACRPCPQADQHPRLRRQGRESSFGTSGQPSRSSSCTRRRPGFSRSPIQTRRSGISCVPSNFGSRPTFRNDMD